MEGGLSQAELLFSFVWVCFRRLDALGCVFMFGYGCKKYVVPVENHSIVRQVLFAGRGIMKRRTTPRT